MHPVQLRAVIPQDQQTGLPPEIYYQPTHVGGSLGFGGKPTLESMWDKLDAEAAAKALPGPGQSYLQTFNNFLFQATPVSQLVVPYNRLRTYLMLQNNGAAAVRVGFGREADLNSGFAMAAGGGFYEPILGTVSSIHAISAAGTNNVVVIEGFRAP
jgi:hypothetical protein